jgi:hypothetical protein
MEASFRMPLTLNEAFEFPGKAGFAANKSANSNTGNV